MRAPAQGRETGAKLRYLLAMSIFGTIGLFVRFLPLSPAEIAMYRGVAGAALLLAWTGLRRRPLVWGQVRRAWGWLLLSGAVLGFNWVLLYESYRRTTVAIATVCYNMAPVILVALSPVLFREKLTPRRLGCVLMALAGVVCISGTGAGAAGGADGILFGLGAAVFYAGVIAMNKRLTGVGGTERTIVQLTVASAALLPYVLLTQPPDLSGMDAAAWGALAVVCVVHTAFCYQLYFSAIPRLPGHTIALFSYADPVVAILLSALLLREPFTPLQALGSALVITGAFLSEVK